MDGFIKCECGEYNNPDEVSKSESSSWIVCPSCGVICPNCGAFIHKFDYLSATGKCIGCDKDY